MANLTNQTEIYTKTEIDALVAANATVDALKADNTAFTLVQSTVNNATTGVGALNVAVGLRALQTDLAATTVSIATRALQTALESTNTKWETKPT